MKKCVEFKGYQIDVEISDVLGTGVVAVIRPLNEIAVTADARAKATDKDNLIVMKMHDRAPEDLEGPALLEIGLRAAIIEIELRLSRADFIPTRGN